MTTKPASFSERLAEAEWLLLEVTDRYGDDLIMDKWLDRARAFLAAARKTSEPQAEPAKCKMGHSSAEVCAAAEGESEPGCDICGKIEPASDTTALKVGDWAVTTALAVECVWRGGTKPYSQSPPIGSTVQVRYIDSQGLHHVEFDNARIVYRPDQLTPIPAPLYEVGQTVWPVGCAVEHLGQRVITARRWQYDEWAYQISGGDAWWHRGTLTANNPAPAPEQPTGKEDDDE
jgi:hypothetical protein